MGDSPDKVMRRSRFILVLCVALAVSGLTIAGMRWFLAHTLQSAAPPQGDQDITQCWRAANDPSLRPISARHLQVGCQEMQDARAVMRCWHSANDPSLSAPDAQRLRDSCTDLSRQIQERRSREGARP